MCRKNKVAAFTLLECLLALVILSGSVLVLEGLTKLLTQEVHHQSHRIEQDWLVFSDQLRMEWQSSRLIKVEADKVYVDKEGQGLAFGKSRSDDFRKTNDRGKGYQPMLYRVQSVAASQTGDLVRLDIVFDTGEERSFVYRFTENS